ncbi:MAG: cobalamin-dependent protein [SAR324 cluster bacterium]|nr:cobalamin-dependent protein [SAR324 cluster bacterium]
MISTEIYNNYLSNLLSGNRANCSKVVEELLDQKIPVQELYLELFQSTLYEVGKLWEKNEISVAVEHMATAITEGLLNLVYPVIFSGDRVGKSVVIACVAKEFHQIGAKMIADIFELNGWDSFFLGANTPSQELQKMIEEKQPDLLGLSMSLSFSMPRLEKMINEVQFAFPQLAIIVGGQGLQGEGRSLLSKYSNVTYIDSIGELEKTIGVSDG